MLEHRGAIGNDPAIAQIRVIERCRPLKERCLILRVIARRFEKFASLLFEGMRRAVAAKCRVDTRFVERSEAPDTVVVRPRLNRLGKRCIFFTKPLARIAVIHLLDSSLPARLSRAGCRYL